MAVLVSVSVVGEGVEVLACLGEGVTIRLPSILPQNLLLLWLVMKRMSLPNWT